MRPVFDDRDRALLVPRQAWYDAQRTPTVGDFVRFADGITRRISYVWPNGVQTSAGGSIYLDVGVTSFSGSLYPSVPHDSLTLTTEREPGGFWFFHHDYAGAFRGVDFTIPCRVWACSLTGRDPYRPAPLAEVSP